MTMDEMRREAERLIARGGKPTVPEVLPLVWALYATDDGAVGCCLHVVLDDGNEGSVDFCVGVALEREHMHCEVLARLLMLMSFTQRRKLSARAYEQQRAHWNRSESRLILKPSDSSGRN